MFPIVRHVVLPLQTLGKVRMRAATPQKLITPKPVALVVSLSGTIALSLGPGTCALNTLLPIIILSLLSVLPGRCFLTVLILNGTFLLGSNVNRVSKGGFRKICLFGCTLTPIGKVASKVIPDEAPSTVLTKSVGNGFERGKESSSFTAVLDEVMAPLPDLDLVPCTL